MEETPWDRLTATPTRGGELGFTEYRLYPLNADRPRHGFPTIVTADISVSKALASTGAGPGLIFRPDSSIHVHRSLLLKPWHLLFPGPCMHGFPGTYNCPYQQILLNFRLPVQPVPGKVFWLFSPVQACSYSYSLGIHWFHGS
jgi:hypothetical protein